jgi:steroid 5-alpha reductase family enzyme
MSLKAFHIFFVSVSVLLMLSVGAWCFGNYRRDGVLADLFWGIASLVVAAGLAVYGKYFLKRLKHISYL